MTKWRIQFLLTVTNTTLPVTGTDSNGPHPVTKWHRTKKMTSTIRSNRSTFIRIIIKLQPTHLQHSHACAAFMEPTFGQYVWATVFNLWPRHPNFQVNLWLGYYHAHIMGDYIQWRNKRSHWCSIKFVIASNSIHFSAKNHAGLCHFGHYNCSFLLINLRMVQFFDCQE